MRTYTNASTMSIEYPDNQVFSGDLNRIKITKNTTATHVQISFNLGASPFNYKENLYFLTSSVEFSLADVLKLIYARTVNTAFPTGNSFYFTVKLYNNTSLLDTENLSIEAVYLGKRRIFDALGVIPTFSDIDFDPTIGINAFYYKFDFPSKVYYKPVSGAALLLGTFNGYAYVDFSAVTVEIDYIYYVVNNYILNPTCQYLGGDNYWTFSEFSGCGTELGITALNKMRLICLDVSCGSSLEIDYTGGYEFEPSKYYNAEITIDVYNNPSSGDMWFIIDAGGNEFIVPTTIGVNTIPINFGLTSDLKMKALFEVDTTTYGSHAMSITNIVIKEIEANEQVLIETNDECLGVGKKLGLRFLNRFGLWRYYYVIQKVENLGATKGIPLWFLEDNTTEFNDTYAEQQKGETQSLSVFIEGLSKELANDFSDVISSDHVHLYDEINEVWIPVRVLTNSFPIVEKDNLFDVSLNLLLQSNE